MGDIFCFIIKGTFDITQFVIDLLYSFWGLFGVTAPDLSKTIGSFLGCNL